MKRYWLSAALACLLLAVGCTATPDTSPKNTEDTAVTTPAVTTAETTDAHEHEIVTDPAVAPTCTTPGYTQGAHCAICDKIIIPQEVIPASHTVVEDSSWEATCQQDGRIGKRYCSVCGEVFTPEEQIKATGHNWEIITLFSQVSCDYDGWIVYGCTYCDELYDYTEPAWGHTYSTEWTIITEPSCRTGRKAHLCLTCGHWEDWVEVPAVGRCSFDNPESMCPGCHTVGSYESGLEFRLNDDKKSYTVYGFLEDSPYLNAATLTVPASFNGKPVTAIADDALSKGSCTSVVLPNTLRHIGDNNFHSLESLYIPDNVQTIGIVGWNGCPYLTSITVSPNNKTFRAMGNCLIDIQSKTLILGCKTSTIPSDGSVTKIGSYAFYSCEPIEQIVIPAPITHIAEYAFYSCEALKNITLPDSLVHIGAHAFERCYALEKIVLPDRIEVIGKEAFRNCSQLTEVVFPTQLKILEKGAFSYCDLLYITLPDGCTTIGDFAFTGNTHLVTVTLPHSIQKIGSSAFFQSFYRVLGSSGYYDIAFQYEGSKADWYAIEKGDHWCSRGGYSSGDHYYYNVQCIDGIITYLFKGADGSFTEHTKKGD